jgi:hypothetical protein
MNELYNDVQDDSIRWTETKTARDDGGPDVYRCDDCGDLLGFHYLDDVRDYGRRVPIPTARPPAGDCYRCGGLCYAVTLTTMRDVLGDTLQCGDDAGDVLKLFMDVDLIAPEGFESLRLIVRRWESHREAIEELATTLADTSRLSRRLDRDETVS